VKSAIAKKNTLFGTKSKLAFIVWMKIGPASTTKNTKGIIVWCDIEKFFGGCQKIENFCRKQVDEECCCKKSFILKFERHGGIGKQS
jgi:hypothetical protein